MPKGRSMKGRALLALVLMIGFFALALTIIGGLLLVTYLGITSGGFFGIKVAIGSGISALIVIRAVIPRREIFAAPGPLLRREDCPELFDVIDEIARDTGQEVPTDVYLVNEVNAFVTRRGGFMGFGSTPVMGIGLPLLQALDTEEARGVIAHEFGHFVGGDTKLGPWIYTTRAAIGRTVVSLTEADSWLSKPFLWYGTLFLRITHAISRRQEFQADEVAVKVTGAAAMKSGLRKVHGAALAFDAYWSGECVPVLESGYRTSIHEGFARFTAHEKLSGEIDEALVSAMKEGKADPYDTHPPLPERLAAIDALAAGAPSRDPGAAGDSALRWLRDVDRLELRLLASLAGPEEAGRLQPLAWGDTAITVFAPAWQRRSSELDALTGTMTLADIRGGQELIDFGRAALGPMPLGNPHSPEWYSTFLASGVNSLGDCVAAALIADGWTPFAPLAEPFYLEKDGQRFEPWAELGRLATEEIDDAGWRARVEFLGIASLPLTPTAATASAAAAAGPAARQTDFFGLG